MRKRAHFVLNTSTFLLSFFSLCLLSGNNACAESSLYSNVPAGFESLLEPQTTSIDVFYGRELLLSTLAEYTPTTIEFLYPEEVISKIPDLISRATLTNYLTGAIDSHPELVCLHGRNTECGILTPEFIGVIFDESRFRIDLFIQPDLLTLRKAQQFTYLPEPSSNQTSWLQNLSATYSGNSDKENQYTFSGNSFLSKGSKRLNSEWAFNKQLSSDNNSQGSALNIDTLSYQQDDKLKEYQAGWLRSRNDSLSFIRSEDVVGFNFGRTLKTRLDLDQLRGNTVNLFLTERSKVDIYKDGRLLTSRIYDLGNQTLDTARLPTGSYPIMIKSIGISGEEKTTQRFFVKSTKLPPQGFPLYYVQAGQVIRKDNEHTLPVNINEWVLRSGYQKRISKNNGFSIGIAGAETHAVFEGGLLRLTPLYELNTTLMTSSQGDYGQAWQANTHYKKLTGSLSTRRTWAKKNQHTVSRYLLVDQTRSQQGLRLGLPLYSGQLAYQFNRSKQQNQESSTSNVWRYNQPLLRTGKQFLNLDIEYGHNDGDSHFNLGLQLRHIGKHLSASLSPRFSRQNPKESESNTVWDKSANIDWRDRNIWPQDVSTSLKLNKSSAGESVTSSTRYGSIYGIAEAEVAQNSPDTGSSNRQTSIRYSTTLMGNPNANTFGGQRPASAGVILDLDSDTQKGVFDVLVDGNRRAVARTGRKVALPLLPYQSYDIKLIDRGDVFIASDNKERVVTLYPGNVETLRYNVPRIYIAFGRIVTPEVVCAFIDENECIITKAPFRHALIRGSHGLSTTNDDGTFQIELTADTRILLVKKQNQVCLAKIPPVVPDENSILYFDTIECKASEMMSDEALKKLNDELNTKLKQELEKKKLQLDKNIIKNNHREKEINEKSPNSTTQNTSVKALQNHQTTSPAIEMVEPQ